MQKSVSLSTAEAEYFGAMMAARDLIFGGRSISMPKAFDFCLLESGSRTISEVEQRIFRG